MRTAALVIAIAAIIALGSPVRVALAQGKGVDAPSDTPSTRPSDRPSGIPGAGVSGGSDTPSKGGNAPANTDTPAAPPNEPAAPVERWNSAAAAIWHVGGRVRVAIGYSGTTSSSESARSRAISACADAGGRGCKAIGAWSAGCLYITTGHTASRAGWASGASSEAALKKCRGDGFTCKPPIGGCLE